MTNVYKEGKDREKETQCFIYGEMRAMRTQKIGARHVSVRNSRKRGEIQTLSSRPGELNRLALSHTYSG
jgi:hypothetical protein